MEVNFERAENDRVRWQSWYAMVNKVPALIVAHPNQGEFMWSYWISETVKISSRPIEGFDNCVDEFKKQLGTHNWKEAALYYKDKKPEPYKNCGEGI